MPKYGHKHKLIKDDSKELMRIKADPRFKARIAKINSTPIIRKFDVPYLCGYSDDASKVYFDRNLETKWKGHDLSKFLRIHELTEKAILDCFDFKYQQAHHFASHFERKAVENAGLDWDEYQEHLTPFIKKVHKEHLSIVPPDLDLEPYADENEKKLLKTLAQKEKKETKSIKEHLTETKISLEYHDELNPVLWDGAKLKPEVREKLLQFAHTWAEFARIDRSLIMDIIMTGGNANYNYTKKSDIDVHLVIDRNAMGTNRELIDEYLQDKKVLWTLTHKISILGYALEPYAQDNGDRYPANQGVYSLKRSRWVQFPNRGNYNWKDDPSLKRKVMFYKKLINQIISDKMDIGAVKDLKNKIKTMRAASIAAGGEFSFENLVFKELRNRGYLDKMNRYEQSLKDKELSL
jgi:hypothetical protein